MTWDVEGTDAFAEWYGSLDEKQQTRIDFVIEQLVAKGPTLTRPYADTVSGSVYPNMKELRAQAGGDPLRMFFAFDPNRTAIILIGGDKTGDKRFYETMIAQADALYTQYLKEIEKERSDA